MTNQITYVFFAYTFTFSILILIGLKFYLSYLRNRKIFNKINIDINNKK